MLGMLGQMLWNTSFVSFKNYNFQNRIVFHTRFWALARNALSTYTAKTEWNKTRGTNTSCSTRAPCAFHAFVQSSPKQSNNRQKNRKQGGSYFMWPTDQWATQLASSRFAYFQIVYFSQALPRGARSCCSSLMAPGSNAAPQCNIELQCTYTCTDLYIYTYKFILAVSRLLFRLRPIAGARTNSAAARALPHPPPQHCACFLEPPCHQHNI
jgi:hypothetical protein